jgi:hypothetical protein
MVFRIRYRQRTDGKESQVLIEAGTPTEALVKFRHTCGQAHASAGDAQSVTCISGDADDASSQPAGADRA